MAAKVITVAQQKGGAGKTTIVAHLAVAFRQSGLAVATVDTDPQGSLTRWAALRAERLGEPDITHRQISGWRTANEVDRLSGTHDMVLIDSAPHAETEARIAVRAARISPSISCIDRLWRRARRVLSRKSTSPVATRA